MYNRTIQIRLSVYEKEHILSRMRAEGYHNLSQWARLMLLGNRLDAVANSRNTLCNRLPSGRQFEQLEPAAFFEEDKVSALHLVKDFNQMRVGAVYNLGQG